MTGANGTGKTTLLRMLAGLLGAGRRRDPVERRGVAPFDPRAARRDRLRRPPAVAQGRAHRRGEPRFAGRPWRARPPRAPTIAEALDNVALSRQRALPARVLSQGQRRRIGLARLTLLPRPLWILDEPVTALDAAGTELLARIVAGHLKRRPRRRRDPRAARPSRRPRAAARAGLMMEPAVLAPAGSPAAAADAVCRASAGRWRATSSSRCARARNSACNCCSTSSWSRSFRCRRRPSATCSRPWGRACCGSRRCWLRCCRCRACSPATTPTARWSRSRCRRTRWPRSSTARSLAHWLTTGLPVVLLAPLLGLQYAMDGESLAVLTAALLLGTPILSLLGAIGAALTLGLRASGSLLALLILPLYVPVLIFGAGAVDAARAGLGRHRESFAARRGTAGRDGRRAVRGRGRRAHRSRLRPSCRSTWFKYASPATFYPARREDDPVVRGGRPRCSPRSASTSGSSSRRPISSRATRTGSSSSTCPPRG